jgi:CBS domain-containing protein
MHMMSTVKEIMTPRVVTIAPDQTIETAARLMTRHSISSLVVCEDEAIIGIITERDITSRIVAVGQNPREITVSEIMSPDIVTCAPSTTLAEACETMQQNRIKKLAVFDDSQLKGIISLTDIAQRHPELMEKLNNMREKRNGNGVDDIINLIQCDEGHHLEFKASLRVDRQSGNANPALELVVMKTICAFMNAEGGTLLIGLTDDNKVIGIDDDYPLIKGHDRDGYQNFIISKLSNCVGNYFLQYVSVSFHNLLGKDLCQVDVRPSDKPAYLSNKGKQEFVVRTGNNSRPFKISEAAQYITKRWG